MFAVEIDNGEFMFIKGERDIFNYIEEKQEINKSLLIWFLWYRDMLHPRDSKTMLSQLCWSVLEAGVQLNCHILHRCLLFGGAFTVFFLFFEQNTSTFYLLTAVYLWLFLNFFSVVSLFSHCTHNPYVLLKQMNSLEDICSIAC